MTSPWARRLYFVPRSRTEEEHLGRSIVAGFISCSAPFLPAPLAILFRWDFHADLELVLAWPWEISSHERDDVGCDVLGYVVLRS